MTPNKDMIKLWDHFSLMKFTKHGLNILKNVFQSNLDK